MPVSNPVNAPMEKMDKKSTVLMLLACDDILKKFPILTNRRIARITMKLFLFFIFVIFSFSMAWLSG
jgi:hypothetical protein